MIDVYGSLGSAQSSNCAGSAVFPSNYMTGAPASAYLDKEKEVLNAGTKVALAVGVVAAGAALYWVIKGSPSTLAANDAYSPFPIERLPGGRAAGMRPSDFDPNELRRGTEHELEHTDDWRLAREIAMDHLAEDEGYYEKLEAMERGTFRDNSSLARDRERWEKLRADYLATEKAAQDLDMKLSVKYGRSEWASKTELKKLTQLRERKDRIREKMFEITERVSPRDWGRGVPAHWIASSLPWEDVVRPLGEKLSVTPPLAYGHTEPMRDNPQPWARVFG